MTRQNRHHRTLKSQLVADKVATFCFTATGLGVIGAVVGMMVFFVSTILPLLSTVQLELERLSLNESGLGEPAAFVHDANSPFAVEAHNHENGCNILQGLSLAASHGRESAESSGTLGRWQTLVSHELVWPLEATAGPLLRAASGQSSDSAFEPRVRCFPLRDSRFLVVRDPQGRMTGQKSSGMANLGVAVVVLDTRRRFLASSELAELGTENLKKLEQQRWLVTDDQRFLAKASLEAPVAELQADTQVVMAIGGAPKSTDSASSATEWTDGQAERFVNDLLPALQADHVLLPGDAFPPSRQALIARGIAPGSLGEGTMPSPSLLMLVQSKENFLTGAKESEPRLLWLEPELKLVGMLPGGEWLLLKDAENFIWKVPWASLWSAPDHSLASETATESGLLESSHAQSHKLESVVGAVKIDLALTDGDHETTPILDAGLSFGNNTLVAVGINGQCGGFDVSRFVLKQEVGKVPPRWRSPCLPAGLLSKLGEGAGSGLVDLVVSPSQRLGVVVLEGQRLATLDLSTGETLSQVSVPDALGVIGQPAVVFERNGFHLQLASKNGVAQFKVHAKHLEGSLGRMFTRVHYEGYQEPSFSWQSASGTDDFEAKFSLWPLVWGTLKATLYAMLFAAPLGIFAAVYSSEILDRTTRNFIKPTIEMMASLPSVVLGYLAAVVLAPWIESNILGVILCGLVLPCVLYFFGNIVSRYSAKHVSGRGLYASRRLLILILVAFSAATVCLMQAGRFIETLAFGGDLKIYLSGGDGSAAVLYGILILPLVLISLWMIPVGRFAKAWRTFVFVAGPAVAFAIGYGLHDSIGESVMSIGGYSQRNALVICIAMGFAIIPIIYSLAEDALTSVPGSLRAGSLACGASVWQTTARVVLPTAASGIFSALMVGFGRAIGETMIVVMATGNSPLMSFNPFEGLRSLAANIAVELPEAPQGGTHYRILFFSGFLLFVLTFCMNTLAEIMRTRYRQRNKAL